MNKVLLSIFFSLLLSLSNAQFAGKKNSGELSKKDADQLAAGESYYNAVNYFNQAMKSSKVDVKTMHEAAEMNRKLRNYVTAERYYIAELKKDSVKYPNDFFYLAQMQKMNGNYEAAKQTFQKYLKLPADKNTGNLKSLATIEMNGCDSALLWLNKRFFVEVKHLEGVVNNYQTDFAPKPIDATHLLYSTFKSDTAIKLNDNPDDYYSKLYIATRSAQNVWESDSAMPFPPNENTVHISNGVYGSDGNTLYYTRCFDKTPSHSHCDLYRVEKLDDGNWTAPVELKSLNDSNFTTTQPAIGKDKDGKDILYFVSDRGAKGNTDIFYAGINNDGSFGEVKSLGAEVNTEFDEFSPYYDSYTQTLYFSSAGFPGMGGLDIFALQGFPAAWEGSPRNMGVGINSSADDMYYVLEKNGRYGFLVSNREGTKSLLGATSGDDIWSFKILTDVIVKISFANKYDGGEQQLSGVGVSAFKRKTEEDSFKFIRRQNTVEGEPLTFKLKRGEGFKIAAQKEGFKEITAAFSIDMDEVADTIEQVYYIDSLAQMERRKIKIGNFYFAFNDTTIFDYYHKKLDTLYEIMKENLSFGLEVQGYTDTVGTEEYNLKLSQLRADEAKRYLISKGIDSTRISAIGYGEMLPMLQLDTIGVTDSLLIDSLEAEARARTRSVEFRLLYDEQDELPVIEYDASELIDSVKTGPGYEIVSHRKRSKKRR